MLFGQGRPDKAYVMSVKSLEGGQLLSMCGGVSYWIQHSKKRSIHGGKRQWHVDVASEWSIEQGTTNFSKVLFDYNQASEVCTHVDFTIVNKAGVLQLGKEISLLESFTLNTYNKCRQY